MSLIKLPDPDQIDLLAPLQIAERVWWVGHVQPDDPFQCHVYLIENGDQSVLFDPGSQLTFDHTLKKIEQILPFDQIRYFVCHHQDPDITGALPRINEMVTREDAVIVTHWRAAMLIKHYGLDLPFWQIEDNAWCLQLEDRRLKFIFTPYAHFPGAFCTFDTKSGILFSSDLFGGTSDNFQLVAQDESHFETIRPFHEHYIPSSVILKFALKRLAEHPIELIAPQHGSLIPKPLIPSMFRGLEDLDCGLYLLAEENTDIHRLSELNAAMRDMTQAMILHRDFCDIANRLAEVAERFLPVRKITYYVSIDEEVLRLAESNQYRGEVVNPPQHIADILNSNRSLWHLKEERVYILSQKPIDPVCDQCNSLVLPLFAPDSGRVKAVAIFCLKHLQLASEEVDALVGQMSIPLQVAIERESIYRQMDLQRQELFQRSVHDPLTGLFNRFYMIDAARRMFAIHDRNSEAAVGLIMVDIDHFKSVNDTYGHLEGDQVLKRVAGLIMDQIRQSDMAIRLGGEEFVIFLPNIDLDGCANFAERLRVQVAEMAYEGAMSGRQVTASFGVALREQQEELKSLIGRADQMLYTAKRNGRNQVQADPPSSVVVNS